jgi:hypothetical protein
MSGADVDLARDNFHFLIWDVCDHTTAREWLNGCGFYKAVIFRCCLPKSTYILPYHGKRLSALLYSSMAHHQTTEIHKRDRFRTPPLGTYLLFSLDLEATLNFYCGPGTLDDTAREAIRNFSGRFKQYVACITKVTFFHYIDRRFKIYLMYQCSSMKTTTLIGSNITKSSSVLSSRV